MLLIPRNPKTMNGLILLVIHHDLNLMELLMCMETILTSIFYKIPSFNIFMLITMMEIMILPLKVVLDM